MLLNNEKIKLSKEIFHGIIVYVIAIFLYTKGLNPFKAAVYGAIYGVFVSYIYLFIKKETPITFFTLFGIYAFFISGW
ncbi:hypothetical protein EDC58_1996 [Caminibacter pacificus]|uniref:Uncharacterized protein n=1 Tax=Caminibacter pacificus TaxID=1424653 RepID=A0AAJ4RB56_9BACT|nr:hypothetical protein EDC58_1996 [Caminibacter pacificus]